MSENEVNLVFFLKPDAVIRRYIGARVLKILKKKLPHIRFLTFKEFEPSREFLADYHYVEHKGKFFFNWLLNYTTSAPIILTIINGKEDDVKKIREILGPTMVQKALEKDPLSIRGRFGIYGGINVAHASDAISTAQREFNIWKEYLERELNLKIDEGCAEKNAELIDVYIETYIDYPIIDNERYRELCEIVLADPNQKDKIKQKIVSLLKKETNEKLFKSKSLEVFADIMIGNLFLRK